MTNTNDKRSFVILAVVFGSALFMLAMIYSQLPELPPEHKALIKLPSDIEDAKVNF